MMGRGDGPGAGAAGGPNRHVPVLLEEVCETLDIQARRHFHRRHIRRRRLHARNSRWQSPQQSWSPSTVTRMRLRRMRRSSQNPKTGSRSSRVVSAVSTDRSLEGRARVDGRRARYRRVVDAARRSGARFLVPQRRSARHADGAGRPERRRPEQ